MKKEIIHNKCGKTVEKCVCKDAQVKVVVKKTALLTVFGLDKMKPQEMAELKVWLRKIATKISKEQYARVTRFRLIK